MKRKVKLTELSKLILVSSLLLILFIGFLLIADERNKKIENGEIIQISESYRNWKRVSTKPTQKVNERSELLLSIIK